MPTNTSKKLNDLKKLCHWLRANTLRLNVQKTGFVLFQSRQSKVHNVIKVKLDGKRSTPTRTVKYLVILLDQHLNWFSQISQVKMKLTRRISIVSKL